MPTIKDQLTELEDTMTDIERREEIERSNAEAIKRMRVRAARDKAEAYRAELHRIAMQSMSAKLCVGSPEAGRDCRVTPFLLEESLGPGPARRAVEQAVGTEEGAACSSG